MSSHQSSAVLALIGLAAWATLALRHPEVGAKRQITGFVISGIIGLLVGYYLSIVTGQVSTIAEALLAINPSCINLSFGRVRG